MKLSEALRLGEFVLEPIKGQLWYEMDSNGPCGGCAVGRVMYVVGYRPENAFGNFARMRELAEQFWPWIKQASKLIPAGTKSAKLLDDIYRDNFLCRISDLYERDDWSMQRIADWVESIEPKEVPANQEVAHDPAPVAVPASGRG